jgi:CRP-like cAMP-binding protein
MVARLSRRSALGPSEREALLALPYQMANLDRDDFIAREGDEMTHCCLLLSGYAYAYKLAGNGARQILSFHIRGDLLGLHGGAAEPNSCNLQPLASVKALLVPHKPLLDIAAQYPEIGRALWAEASVSNALLGEWLLNVGQRDARGRICHLLCELARRQAEAGICSGPDFEWPMTQEQLGDATGLTSVHVNRVVQRLRAEGWVRTTGRRVLICDWHRLSEAGDCAPGLLQAA